VKRRSASRFSLHNYIVRIINHHDVSKRRAVGGMRGSELRTSLSTTDHFSRAWLIDYVSYYVDAVSLDIFRQFVSREI